jgi:hypothetical protein
MSYIITSNIDINHKNGKNVALNNGINRPFSYQNAMDNIMIGKNSEIAVQSVKVNREGNIELSQMNNRFGLFLGKALQADSDATPFWIWNDYDPTDSNSLSYNFYGINQPNIGTIRDVSGEYSGGFTITEFQRALQESFRLFTFHPNFLISNINPTGVVVSGSYSAGVFQGYNFQFNQPASSENVNNASEMTDFIKIPFTDAKIGDPDNASLTLSASGNDLVIVNEEQDIRLGADQCALLNGHPLSLNEGLCEFDITGYATGASGTTTRTEPVVTFLGLTRCQRTSFKGQAVSKLKPYINPPYYEKKSGLDISTWDWVVRIDKNGALRIFHLVVDSGADFSVREVNYKSGLAGDAKLNASVSASGIDGKVVSKVGFQAKGNEMNIIFENASGQKITISSNPYQVTNGATVVNANNQANLLKPISQTCQTVFPKVFIAPSDLSVSGPATKANRNHLVLTHYDAVQITNFTYGGLYKPNRKPDFMPPSPDGYYDKQQDYYAYHLNKNDLDPLSFIDTEVWVNSFNDPTDRNPDYATGDLEIPKTFVSGGKTFIDNEPILVLEASDKYPTRGPSEVSTREILGFFNGVIDVSQDSQIGASEVSGNLHKITYNSQETPKQVGADSSFIRVRNLPIESANMANRHKSKILYHIPKFDNSGQETGSLFFEPAQLTYLKLNNPTDINLNSLEVDLVNTREQLTTNFTGKTVVCFHVRSSKR